SASGSDGKSAWTVIASPEHYNSGRKETAEKEGAEERKRFAFFPSDVQEKQPRAAAVADGITPKQLVCGSAAIVVFVSTIDGELFFLRSVGFQLPAKVCFYCGPLAGDDAVNAVVPDCPVGLDLVAPHCTVELCSQALNATAALMFKEMCAQLHANAIQRFKCMRKQHEL